MTRRGAAGRAAAGVARGRSSSSSGRRGVQERVEGFLVIIAGAGSGQPPRSAAREVFFGGLWFLLLAALGDF